MLKDGRARTGGSDAGGPHATMLRVMNSWHDAVGFTLPEAPEGRGWQLLVDTNTPDAEEEGVFAIRQTY